MSNGFSLSEEFRNQAFMEKFNSMANSMQTSDPRLQELLNMLSKLILGQTMNGLSPNWQTGFEYLGRAVVNSPLGSMMGLSNGADSFTAYHNAIIQQGALKMQQFGTGNQGFSYGAGANTLGLAYHLQQQTNQFARGTGLDASMAAGFLAANIQNNGLGWGDVISYGGSDVTSSGGIADLYRSLQGKAPDHVRNDIARAAVISRAHETFILDNLKQESSNVGKDDATLLKENAALIPVLSRSFKRMSENNTAELEKQLEAAKTDLGYTNLDMSNATSAEIDAAMATRVTGFSYTGVSAEFISKSKAALRKHADNLKDLSEIFDTKNFAELDEITKTLQMGSFQNENHVKKMGERIADAKRTALVTNRDVKDVLAEQGSIMDVLSLAAGGKNFVNDKDISHWQNVKAIYDRNSQRGYDYRTEAEFGSDMVTSAANRRQLFGDVMVGSYLLEKKGDLLNKNIAGTDETYASRIQGLVTKFNSTTDRSEQRDINDQIKSLLKAFGSLITDQDKREAYRNGTLDLNEATRGGLVERNSKLIAEELFATADKSITKGLGDEKQVASMLANIGHVFGGDIEKANEFFDAAAKSDFSLKRYEDAGMDKESLGRLKSVADYLKTGGAGRRGLFRQASNKAQINGRYGMGTLSQLEADNAATDKFFGDLQTAYQNVAFDKDNAFVAALLGESNDLTDAGALLAMQAQGAMGIYFAGDLKNGEFAGNMSDDAKALLGLSGVDTSNYTRKDWYKAFSEAEKNGVVIATDATGKTFVTKKDAYFLDKKEKIAKESDKLKGVAGLAKHMAGVNNISLDNKGNLAITYERNGKKEKVEGRAALADIISLRDSSPEGYSAYKEFIENSKDPGTKALKDELKEYETFAGISKYTGEKDIDADSTIYKALPEFFNAYKSAFQYNDEGLTQNLKKYSLQEMFDALQKKDPKAAKALMSGTAFSAINKIAGYSMGELKGLGYVDAENKFTNKMGTNLEGQSATALVAMMKDAMRKDESSTDLVTQIVNMLKALMSGSESLKVKMA